MSEAKEKKELRLDHRHLTMFFLGAVGVCAVFFILGFLVGRGQSYEIAKKAISRQESGEPAGSSQNNLPTSLPGQPSGASMPAQSSAPPLPPSPANEAVAPHGQIDRGSSTPLVRESTAQAPKKDLDFYQGVKESPTNKKYSVETKPVEKKDSSTGSKPPSQSGPAKSEPVKPKTASAGKTLLSLQVAALRNLEDADQLMKKLRTAGYEVYLVRPSANSSDQLIRVQVGPFASEAEAAKVKSKLHQEGYSAIVKR
jgi:cell division septation protein DedD